LSGVPWLELEDVVERIERDVVEVVRWVELDRRCVPLLSLNESPVYLELVIGEEDGDRRVRMWFRKDRVVHEIVSLTYHGSVDWFFGEKHTVWVREREGIEREGVMCYQMVRLNGEVVARDIVNYASQLEEGREEFRGELGEGS